MTLKEKIDIVLSRKGNKDLEVCIPNNKGGMGGISITKVKYANQGFDWNKDKFIIWPEKDMVERS